MTESSSVKITRLETQMQETKVSINRVEVKVDTLINKIDKLTAVQTEVADIRREINELKEQVAINARHDALTKWVYPTLAAAAGATLAVLIAAVIRK